MFDNYQICPYTGLRSFTEEESLYFKGREENIEQATEQLQRNKFLMLTGASGDGKSSLVYAGIIPYARAGFLKSKYSQWSVADFRPERSPFKNLCKAVAQQLEIANLSTVESELQHGFSALADLYKNSKRFIDRDSIAWEQADEQSRAAMGREASNLIILVDQFEEFFTNPENYYKGVPSKESNLVINLLLETVRIAIDEGLPIYVIFTMRSDFIGQCAAFRGLPEYIGYSQFFVPRLNRSQLQQVIEEPAVLSGNRITRRLTERLIHDLTEGVDQLPILQHALNQIWVAADSGKEEMDLIHYAMVGGLTAAELPDDQSERFNKWYKALPEKIKACYHEPGLQNVLDTHTNKLFEEAPKYFYEKTGMFILEEGAKEIIKTAFTCLTKIDQSRAVRNRMTLEEITQILGKPQYGVKEVGAVLNLFREPGNTFVRPFILEDVDSSLSLAKEDVLDITHESLIRNWAYLEKWAKEEFDNYNIYTDFEQQLNRWLGSNKSDGFLLSIGQLTYFETWYKQLKPNAFWIERYLSDDLDAVNKKEKARQILDNANEFLKKSARKHVVTRTIMRYGPRRIGIAAAIILVLIFSSFTIRNQILQQNSFVLKSIEEQTVELIKNPKSSQESKAMVLALQIMMDNGSIEDYLALSPSEVEKVQISVGLAIEFIAYSQYTIKEKSDQILALTSKLISNLSPPSDLNDLIKLQRSIKDYHLVLGLANHYNPKPEIDAYIKQLSAKSAEFSLHILRNQPSEYSEIQHLNYGIENGVTYGALSEQEAHEIISVLSPFHNDELSDWVKTNYDRDKLLVRSANVYGLKFNGLYQQLAYLFAYTGQTEMALKCIDSLLVHSQGYFLNDYTYSLDNVNNIAQVFFNQSNDAGLDEFVIGYCLKKGINEENFYKRMIGRSLLLYTTTGNFSFAQNRNHNTGLVFAKKELIFSLFDKYRDVVEKTVNDPNEKNYLLALANKDQGIITAFKNLEQINAPSPTFWFDKAFENYNRISPAYLSEQTTAVGRTLTDNFPVDRSFAFLYPDMRFNFAVIEPRNYVFSYFSDAFLSYILDKGLFKTLYSGAKELRYINRWLTDHGPEIYMPSGSIRKPISLETLSKVDKEIDELGLRSVSDLNYLYLYLGKAHKDIGDYEEAARHYEKLNHQIIFNLLRNQDQQFWANNQSFWLIAHAVEGFLRVDNFNEAYKLIRLFNFEINRSSLYAYSAELLLLDKTKPEMVDRILDSARAEMNRNKNLIANPTNKTNLSYSLVLQDPNKNMDEAMRTIKNLPNKAYNLQRIARAVAFHNNLYGAVNLMPDNLSTGSLSFYLWDILYGYNMGNGTINTEWQNYFDMQQWNISKAIVYANESL
jgi:energy-coupling factor transporter ATP-binding protein EcfA2